MNKQTIITILLALVAMSGWSIITCVAGQAFLMSRCWRIGMIVRPSKPVKPYRE